MRKSAIAEAAQTYGIEEIGGAGHFSINSKGHLIARRLRKGDPRFVDIKKVVDDLLSRLPWKLPLILRFPQIFASQVRKMNQSFRLGNERVRLSRKSPCGFSDEGQPAPPGDYEAYLEEATKYTHGLEAGQQAGALRRDRA
jgi:arginine decarboxylase-like protein